MDSILDDAKYIASQPIGVSKPIHPGDAIRVARELLRLLDDTPADYEWAERVGLAEDGLYGLIDSDLCCLDDGRWFIGSIDIGRKTRGQVRQLANGLCRELKKECE